MSQFRQITPSFAASPAPEGDFFEEAAAAGYALIINNRPDGEDPAQVTNAAAATEAAAYGLSYAYVPISGMPGPDEAQAMRAALASAKGPVLAFCRSGTRSTAAWALAQALDGADVDAVLAQARSGGYDLSALAPLMERLKP